MNQIYKIINIISKSKKIKNSLIYNIKTVPTKNKTIFIGSTVFLLGCGSYAIINNQLANKLEISNCSSIFFKENKLRVEWANKPESVKLEDEKLNKEKVEEIAKEDDKIIVNNEVKLEQPVFEIKLDPNTPVSLPTEVPYVIIGAGVAGMSAARAIRASDPFSKVLIINSECQSPGIHKETYPPYRRTLLSKFIWRRTEEQQKMLLDSTGDIKSSSFLFIEPDSFFVSPENLNQLEYGGISLLNGVRVESIDSRNNSVTLEGSGHKITYKTCLIATGSSPRRLRHLERSDNSDRDLYSDGRVTYFRSLNDFRNLSERVKQLRDNNNSGNGVGRILIVGSGLLGTELTSSLGRLAKEQGNLEIIEVYKEKSHLYHLLPEQLSEYIERSLRKNEVKLIGESEVVSIGESIGEQQDDSGRLNVTIKSLATAKEAEHDNSNQDVRIEKVDHVVIAAGVKPDISLADSGCLETDQLLDGYLVNAELQAREGIFVAGDACSFYDPLLGRRRVEHWDHSEESGSIAGHNMAAFVLRTSSSSDTENKLSKIDTTRLANNILKPKIYDFQTSFSLKLSLYKTVEAVGLIDSSLETKTFIATDFFDDLNLEGEKEDNRTIEGGEHKLELVEKEKHHSDALDMPGVVFYLRSGRIVGVLLWNCDDDIVVDSDFPSPLRSNVARKVLADRRLVSSEGQMRDLAADFDLSFYVNSQIRVLDEYVKKKKEEKEKEGEKL